MLQQSAFAALNLDPVPRNLCTVDCAKLNRVAVNLVCFLVLRTKAARTAITLATLTGRLPVLSPLQMQQASVHNLHHLQIIA